MASRLILQRLREKPLVCLTLHHSGIHQQRTFQETLRTLGLRRPNSVVYHRNTPDIRGKIRKVKHLITVQECDGIIPGTVF